MLEAGSARLDPEDFEQPAGRRPKNVLLDEDAAAEIDAQSGATGANSPVLGTEPSCASTGNVTNLRMRVKGKFHADSGGASRFYYVAKPSRRERDFGCEGLPAKSGGEATDREDNSAGLNSPRAGAGRNGGARNTHPTVKPVNLMRYLLRLVTPPGGTVLDPFLGSGTTGMAAMLEGFNFLGIEREEEYLHFAKARIEAVLQRGAP
jgi:site-specific DNA-methyltransferase (adenine-specific)